MTKHPEKTLTTQDIPAPAPGASKFWPGSRKLTGADVDVLILSPDSGGKWRFVENKPSEQAAIRACIRHQKRANRDAIWLRGMQKKTVKAMDGLAQAAREAAASTEKLSAAMEGLK